MKGVKFILVMMISVFLLMPSCGGGPLEPSLTPVSFSVRPICSCNGCSDECVIGKCPQAIFSIEATSNSAIVYEVESLIFINLSTAVTRAECLIGDYSSFFTICQEENKITFTKRGWPLTINDFWPPTVFTLYAAAGDETSEGEVVRYALKKVLIKDLQMNIYEINLNLQSEKFIIRDGLPCDKD